MCGAGGHFADGGEGAGADEVGLGVLEAAVGVGELLGEGAGVFADLGGAEGERPAGGEGGEFLELGGEAVGVGLGAAPDDAADAFAVGFEGDPVAGLAG